MGLYLHGSGALGGFTPISSDLDFLAVVSRPLDQKEKLGISQILSKAHCPARGVEFSAVTVEAARTSILPPPFELHVAKGAELEIVDGLDHPGDWDLVLYFEICRRSGVALHGPEPRALFAPIPRWLIVEMSRRELTWIEEHPAESTLESSLLQACRAWRYEEEGALCSKVAGGEWALTKLKGGSRNIVATAIQLKSGIGQGLLDEAEVLEFVGRIKTRLKVRKRSQRDE